MIDLPEGTFLIPDATVFAEAGVFLVVLFVVAKWVMPRLAATLDQRRRHIEDELRASSLAQAAAKEREEQAAELLRQARREARLIIDRAYERHDYLVAEGRRKGREEYEWFTRTRPLPGEPVDEQQAEVAGNLAITAGGLGGAYADGSCS